MQLQRTNNYTEPKIFPAEPKSSDMSKQWYVWFRFFDASSNSFKQFRFKRGINEFKNFRKRLIEANALKQAIKEELLEGWNPISKVQQLTIKIYDVNDGINYILDIKSSTIRKKTYYAYKYITNLFINWLKEKEIKYNTLKNFTSIQAQHYMDWLIIEKKYSGRTYNDHLIVLRTFFNCFIEREWISKNPFRLVKRKKQTIGRNLAYTEKEKDLLEKHLYNYDRRLFYFTQLMFHSFIRRTEITFLKVKHIDLVNHTIIIPGEHAKNNHQESVVIPKGLESILKEMELSKFDSEHFLFGRYLQTGPVQYKNPNWISSRHNAFIKKLKIDQQKGLYSWKHTGVCSYYNATKDPYAVMRQLRHRDLNTTMIYLKSLGLIQNDTIRNALVA